VALSPWRRVIAALVLGGALGVAFGVFVNHVPRLLGTVLVVGLAGALIVFCLRQLRWARQMRAELRDEQRRLRGDDDE
jgi:hypothetical protein